VAVRLEQGVPLVDADWNEGQDVTRNEVYDGLRAFAPNSALRGGLVVTPAGPGNDIFLSPASRVIGGWPIHLYAAIATRPSATPTCRRRRPTASRSSVPTR